jgi:cytochrome c556
VGLRRIFATVLVAATAIAVGGAALAEVRANDAVAMRINAYRETGAAFKSINDQVRSGDLVKIMLRTSGRTIAATARNQYGWFPQGSGPESGQKTKAKAVIWSDPDGFRAAQARFQKEADLFLKVAEAGDKARIQQQAKSLGEACAACHQKYREK